MALIAITYDDGSVGIMRVVEKKRKLTTEYIKKVISRSVFHKDVVSWREIKETPKDRDFRDAWFDNNGVITHDIVKARGIYRDKLRRARAPMLSELDVDYMKALEAGNAAEQSRIVNVKRGLRDITDDPRIDGAQTVDELRALKLL